ncbi:MAG: helix-turn-helix transcriptional regulator [Acidobacteriota bacterium]
METAYGRALKKNRQSRCLTQAQAGQLVGKSAQAIYDYECGRRVPPGDVAARVERWLGVPALLLDAESSPLEEMKPERIQPPSAVGSGDEGSA